MGGGSSVVVPPPLSSVQGAVQSGIRLGQGNLVIKYEILSLILTRHVLK